MTVERDIVVNRDRFSVSQFSYPSSPAAHNIVFAFQEYTFAGARGGPIRPTSDVSGAVVLPLPTNLQDSYSVKIGADELGLVGSLASEAISDTGGLSSNLIDDINRAVSGAQNGGGSSFSNALSTARQFAGFAGRNALDSIGIGDGAIDVATGTAVNPHVALRFDGVDLKTHNFTWILSPKNEDEARSIRDIIRYIKQQMSPHYAIEGAQSAAGRNLLNYPSLANISFVGVNQDYFYYFKPAMINSFTANYAPNGVALNKGGRPAVVSINMSVTEARIWTREDF
jgi:hypothetical protein